VVQGGSDRGVEVDIGIKDSAGSAVRPIIANRRPHPLQRRDPWIVEQDLHQENSIDHSR